MGIQTSNDTLIRPFVKSRPHKYHEQEISQMIRLIVFPESIET